MSPAPPTIRGGGGGRQHPQLPRGGGRLAADAHGRAAQDVVDKLLDLMLSIVICCYLLLAKGILSQPTGAFKTPPVWKTNLGVARLARKGVVLRRGAADQTLLTQALGEAGAAAGLACFRGACMRNDPGLSF